MFEMTREERIIHMQWVAAITYEKYVEKYAIFLYTQSDKAREEAIYQQHYMSVRNRDKMVAMGLEIE